MSIVSKIGRRINPKNLSYYSQRTILRPSLRESVTGFIASRLPGKLQVTDQETLKGVQTLREDGILPLPDALTPQQVADVTNWMKEQDIQNPYHPEWGTFKWDTAPQDTHVGHPKKGMIVHCPHALAVANHPKYLQLASEFLGCKPTISNLTCWWSFANQHKAMEAELFHRDVDDWKFLKLFIYITDVDEDAGPHIYVKGSAGSNKCLKIRRYEDAEMEQAFGKENILCLTGHAGQTFMENTFGFHKGTPPAKRNRILLQVQYSINPIFAYKYAPVPKGEIKADLNGVELDPYMNRLYVKFD